MNRKTYTVITGLWIIGLALFVNALLGAQSATSQHHAVRIIPKPTAVMNVSQPMSFKSLGKDIKLCPGQTYKIGWSVSGKINTAMLNLIHIASPSSNMIIATNASFNYLEKEKMTRGEYSWIVGKSMGETTDIDAADGYAFMLSITSAKGSNYAVSQPFAILDVSECLSYSTPVITPTITVIPVVNADLTSEASVSAPLIPVIN